MPGSRGAQLARPAPLTPLPSLSPAAAFPHARTWPGSPLPCAPPQLSPQVAGSHLGVFSTPPIFTEHLLRAGHWLGCGDFRRRENEFSDRVGRSPAQGREHYLAVGGTSGERRARAQQRRGCVSRTWMSYVSGARALHTQAPGGRSRGRAQLAREE